jgi:hypothetical protein
MSNVVECYICQNGEFAVELSDEHHVVPTSCGGTDDPSNKKRLHDGCHQNIHRLAAKMRAGKNGEATDLAMQIWQSAPAQKRALELVQIIARSQLATPERAPETVHVEVELSARQYAALRALAEERRRPQKVFGKATGKRRGIGVPKLIVGLVAAHLREHGYST